MWRHVNRWKFANVSEEHMPPTSGSKSNPRRQLAKKETCMLHVSCRFPALPFDPEDLNKTFLQNVGELTHYMKPHPTNWTLHIHRCEPLKSSTAINRTFSFVVFFLLHGCPLDETKFESAIVSRWRCLAAEPQDLAFILIIWSKLEHVYHIFIASSLFSATYNYVHTLRKYCN
jgi:hypothetical protein